MCYFFYSAFWLTGQWGVAIASPPPPGYAAARGQGQEPRTLAQVFPRPEKRP